MGLASFVGLSLLHIRDAVLLGLLAFFGEFVPMVGFLLSGVVGVLVALAQSSLRALGSAICIWACSRSRATCCTRGS